MFHFLIKSLLIIFLTISLLFSLTFFYFYEKVSLDAKNLISYQPPISSSIYDRNGKLLAYIFNKEHRLYTSYEEIPSRLIEGVIAMEDTKFFEHNGVNIDAIIRAIIRDIKAGGFVEGGSTLTQQLIKNKLLSNQKRLTRKIKEAILALKIEQKLSKEEILERYLNEISYGNNYFGVKTASKGYFRKELKELTLKEIAILVGLPNAPSYYNPLRHYKRAIKKANSVLFRMRNLGWISQVEYIKAKKEEPTIYKTSLTQNIAPTIVDEVIRRFSKKFDNLKSGGYKIYTTIDYNHQQIAKKALNFSYNKILKRNRETSKTSNLNGAFISVESKTGDILSMVGSTSYKKSKFNRVTQIKRQPGSAFKPFIYQTALDMGYNPATHLTDLRRTFAYYRNGKRYIWSPKNYERNFKGFITLREALIHSRNLATVNLVVSLGVSTIRDRLGFLDVPHIPKNVSIALGNLGLSPLKMAQIFSIFANNGTMIEPRLVSKVLSQKNSLIYETEPKEIVGFTSKEQAYLMTDILKDVVLKGTGRKAQVKGIELAGKTGTTNKNVDAWFCGYSPTIEAIVWFGRDNNRPIGKGGTGGTASAPAFSYYFKELLKNYPNLQKKFIRPKEVKEDFFEGKRELFTKTSPLPNSKKEKREEENYYYEDEEYAPTIEIEGETNNYNDPLHPNKKAPKSSASTDSGTLF